MVLFIIICLLAGCIGGILQGLLGVGTGIIAIPLLIFLLPHYDIPQVMAMHVALATSMAAITVSSLAALISHHRHKNVQWDIFKKIIVFSLIGSCIGSIIASHLPGRILEMVFAVFMFFVAFKMFAGKNHPTASEQQKTLSITKLAAGGMGIGVSASIVGIGGGLFMVPFLSAQHIQMRYAVGTSTAVGLPVAIIGAATYVITGLTYTAHMPLMLGYLNWPAFLAISLGGILCAGIGVRLAKVMNQVVLKKLFAICILIIGIKMLI